MGPSEAEVRDPGQPGSGGSGSGTAGVINTSSPQATDVRTVPEDNRNMGALMPAILGVGLGLVLVIFMLIILITLRLRSHRNVSEQLHSEDTASRLVSSSPRLTAAMTANTTGRGDKFDVQHTGSCIEREMQVNCRKKQIVFYYIKYFSTFCETKFCI